VDDDILENIKTKGQVYTVDKYSPPVEALTRLITEAKSPVILAGYGCIRSGAQEVITQLSESLNIPVATSLKGKGVISEQSGMSLGSLGVTSSGTAYGYIVEQADLVVFLGASFNERTSYLWDKKLLENKKVAQIDSNAEQLEKVFDTDIAIQGDIKEVLTGVLSNLKEKGVTSKEFKGIPAYYEKQSADRRDKYASLSRGKFALVEKFFAELEKQFPENALIFDDNIIFAQNFFNVSSSNRYFPNSGISSLGHAIPAAIGARFSADKPTFAILGDGGFQMCCMEIMTAVNYDLPINVVVFNNSTMGLIRKNQSQLYDERFINCDFTNPDFAYLAKSFGINHMKISSNAEVDKLFSNYDLTGAINLIEIMIDKNAFPNYRSGR
jgi:acetolactate synthase-1/2/3 large subunit